MINDDDGTAAAKAARSGNSAVTSTATDSGQSCATTVGSWIDHYDCRANLRYSQVNRAWSMAHFEDSRLHKGWALVEVEPDGERSTLFLPPRLFDWFLLNQCSLSAPEPIWRAEGWPDEWTGEPSVVGAS